MHTHNLTISEVLTSLLERAKIKEAQLAKALNVPRATINKIHSGKILDPRSSTLSIIANYFGITIDQLMGKSPLFGDTLMKFIKVPIIELDRLKNFKQALNKIDFINHENWILIEYDNQQSNHDLFAVKVYGDAMLPYFDEQTTIIIDSDSEVANRKYVLAYIASLNEVILRQIFVDGNTRVLKPINTIFESKKLTTKDKIIGVVVQTKRDF